MRPVFVLLLLLIVATPLHADYQRPDPPLLTVLDAPQPARQLLSPDQRYSAVLGQSGPPDISELTRTSLSLGGLRITPDNHAALRTDLADRLELVDLARGQRTTVAGFPPGARLADPAWSADAAQLVICVYESTAVTLWRIDRLTAIARPVPGVRLNATTGRSVAWLGASHRLVVRRLPAGLPTLPDAPAQPAGPVIKQTVPGKSARHRTYPDLLTNELDESRLHWALSSQLAIIDTDNHVTPLATPRDLLDLSPSPDGQYLLLTEPAMPLSRDLPLERAPTRQDVIDLAGHPLLTHPGAPPRRWRSDTPATLYFIRKDPSSGGDELLELPAPFTAPPQRLAAVAQRIGTVHWGDATLALLNETDPKAHLARLWRIDPSRPDSAPHLLLAYRDNRHADYPGKPVSMAQEGGFPRLLVSPGHRRVYLSGSGASLQGDPPFLDALTLDDGRRHRLWQSQAPWHEQVSAILDPEAQQLLLTRENSDTPATLYRYDRRSRQPTQLLPPAPSPAGFAYRKTPLDYRRADGVKLSATLYVPAGYDAGRDGPIPLLMWAYPREFDDEESAAEASASPYRFTRITPASPLALLGAGYAVLDHPGMPVIARHGRAANDHFLEELTLDAEAAVREVVRLGVADPQRIAIGGHSYGAFMTANLLAHSRLFKAGIARSGAYNRSLTPFGFQSETRSFWEAPAVYHAMAPFEFADRIEAPLLLIHGEADTNPGTFTLQSERLYQALNGLGKPVRLVTLPGESHTYRSRQSLGQVLYEEQRWLERWIGPGWQAPAGKLR